MYVYTFLNICVYKYVQRNKHINVAVHVGMHTHTTHQQMPGCIHARLSSPPSQRFAPSQCCLRLPAEVAQVAYATAPVSGRTVSGACLTFPVSVRLPVEVAQAAYGAESKLS